MNPLDSAPKVKGWMRRRPLLAAVLGLAVVAAAYAVLKPDSEPQRDLSYYEVKRGDFLISIVEGGNIEAVKEEIVRSEVEGVARIIYIVPEGSTVKKGDLLVELDSASSQDAVNQQQINVEKAQFAVIQAEQQLAIQMSMVESEITNAMLAVEFAQTDLDKYLKGEALQLRRNAQIEITNVMESLKIAEDRLAWTEELYKKGFETKTKLDSDRLTVSQSRLKLEQAQKALWMLETFDEPKKRRQLEAALEQAKEELERVKLQGERKLEQYKADLQTQKSTLELSKKKLERDIKQLEATKIYAPQDGLVVYGGGGGDRRFSSESFIEEGAQVRNRQELIKLPDISQMKLTVKIHESHINQVRPGQPAYVVLDAMPDRRFNGVVNRVAPLPDSSSRWANPNLKVYATEVFITDPLPNVKPGVSARAEIIVTNLQNVISVPIQAVTTRKGKQVVFLADAPDQPVPVTVGMYNIKFIEITSGLKEGQRVLLSPPFDTEEKDLAGAIVAAGEKLPEPNGTNVLPRPVVGEDFPASPGMENGTGNGERRGRGPGGARRGGEPGIEPGAFRSEGMGPPGGGPDGMRPEGPEGSGQGRRGAGFNREEMLKRFDTNGDGQLDDAERAAMREVFMRERGSRPGGSTNAPAFGNPRPTDAAR